MQPFKFRAQGVNMTQSYEDKKEEKEPLKRTKMKTDCFEC
jgi:hypothetical protein